jgi:hypothetical protein
VLCEGALAPTAAGGILFDVHVEVVDRCGSRKVEWAKPNKG